MFLSAADLLSAYSGTFAQSFLTVTKYFCKQVNGTLDGCDVRAILDVIPTKSSIIGVENAPGLQLKSDLVVTEVSKS